MKRLLFMLTWGGVFKNLICIALKRDMLYIFRQNVSIFNIVLYVIQYWTTKYAKKMSKIMRYIMPRG